MADASAAAPEVDPGRMLTRLRKLHSQWMKASSGPQWGDASALCAVMGKRAEDISSYFKTAALFVHIFGYELTDTIFILTKPGTAYVLSSNTKIKLLEPVAAASLTGEFGNIKLELLTRSKADGSAAHFETLIAAVKAQGGGGDAGTPRLGVITKDRNKIEVGPFAEAWKAASTAAGVEIVDVTTPLSLLLAVKDKEEVELMRTAAMATNRLVKKIFVSKMEDIIENDSKISHEALSNILEEHADEPSKMKLKMVPEDVETTFTPSIQSGGVYDLKPGVGSTADNLTPDIVIVSAGLRYRNYCGTITRTFFVNAPDAVTTAYNALLQAHTRALDALRAGTAVKDVVEAARSYLKDRHPHLLPHLTKSLGFALGVDFKEKALELTEKNVHKIKQGMVFALSLGLHDVPLTPQQRKGSSVTFDKYSIAIGDMVLVTDEAAEQLTKLGNQWNEVSYELGGDDDEEGSVDGDGDDMEVDSPAKKSKSEGKAKKERGGGSSSSIHDDAPLEGRLRKRGNDPEVQDKINQREQRMSDLLKKKARDRASEMARRGKKEGDESDEEEVEDLKVYDAPDQYPDNTFPHMIKVDMDREVVLCPVNGQPVPFAIHTIKNVVLPEPDNHAHYLRINFFAPGQALGKEASRRMARLIDRHSQTKQTFIKELTFRSLEPRNLTLAFRQIQELRKRLKLREQKAEQEADLVVQAKLIRMTDMKVPRLADLTLRPNITGKTTGALEAHTNGLRFISIKGESIEVLYANIRLAVYQPCEGKDTKVVLHFHLKHPIMVGKKAHKDIQVYTEAMDSTVNLDNARRSNFDPDEIEEEVRDKRLRKKMNEAFKDFAAKVSKVALRNQQELEFDIPYLELGFYGTPFKEMVFVQPTTYALLNVTDQPFFVVPLDDIEHVHFERVNPSGRNFDIKLILRSNVWNDGAVTEPLSINMVEQRYLHQIMNWLVDSDITYTQTDKAWTWKTILSLVREDDRFYQDTDADGEKKPAGWAFLRMEGDSDDEGEDDGDEESDFAQASGDDDEESDESFADDDSEEDASGDGSDAESEEEGESWEDLERKAAADDNNKREFGGHEEEHARKKSRKR